ncbi:glycosyltransferase [Aquibium microcysteis]|uniref:glycosyltransferase n=1 Tax=Aquibium microcysteis TaxID=675281 RepID=UPI001EF3281F|nr:glycosyltransferase [Aquibium microcysteis]
MRRRHARTIVHLERVHPAWVTAGERNLLVPNQERFPRRQAHRLRDIDLVLAKTAHAAGIFSTLGRPTRFIGFSGEDRRDLSVERDWSRFFHLAGGSTLKGTEDVVALWRRHPEWPQLVLVQKAGNAPGRLPPNVVLIQGYLSDAELRRHQNSCGIHLCPSRAEGWGHHIVEALSVGAVVVTTDGPPMNELVGPDCGVLVPVASTEPRHLGTCYHVDVAGLERSIETLIGLPDAAKEGLGAAARRRYEEMADGFAERMSGLDV